METIYQSLKYKHPQIEHCYGSNFHLISDPLLLSQLATLSSMETTQPQINQLVEFLYSSLLQYVINSEFPRSERRVETRMKVAHPKEAFYFGDSIKRDQPVVSVNLARAGTLPSHVCYNMLNYILNPKLVRQDHISINRSVDEQEKVIGAQLTGHKIGGSVRDSIVLIPDPMGATGSTLVSIMDLYKMQIEGPALKYIALHLIVTPEYLKKINHTHPDLIVFALRLDRGLSENKIFKTVPGSSWNEEKGLNDKQYIVPGAGGLGEILNNSYV